MLQGLDLWLAYDDKLRGGSCYDLLFCGLPRLQSAQGQNYAIYIKGKKQGIFYKKLALKSDLSTFKACGKAKKSAVLSGKFFHKFHKSLALL